MDGFELGDLDFEVAFDDVEMPSLDGLSDFSFDLDPLKPPTAEERKETDAWFARLDGLMEKHKGNKDAVIRELYPECKKQKRGKKRCQRKEV